MKICKNQKLIMTSWQNISLLNYVIRDKKSVFFACKSRYKRQLIIFISKELNRFISLAHFLKPERFDEHSDIDLAVKGIDNLHTRLKIEARLMQIFQDADFDLVWLDDETEIKPHVLRAIKKEGKLCLRIR